VITVPEQRLSINSSIWQAGDANDGEPASGAEHEALARDDLREGQREEHSHQRHGQRARQVRPHASLLLGIRIRMLLGLPGPDPLVRGSDPDPFHFS
jgi:hypothetical protein